MASGLLSQYVAVYGPSPIAPDADPKAKQAWNFSQRVKVAIVATAVTISTEATTVPDHANRAAFATQVLRTPDLYAGAFAIALASQGIDQSNTDADIVNMVAIVWNGFSG